MVGSKHIGIDVSKRTFDLHIFEDNKDLCYENTRTQIKKCVNHLLKLQVGLVVLESTGGYELELLIALQTAGLPAAMVNPRQIRNFAKARGKLAKTDKIDAKIIADFGATLQPPVREVISENQRVLKALVARRSQLNNSRTAELNRMEHTFEKEVERSLKIVVGVLDQEIERINQEIKDRIYQEPELTRKVKLLKSVPGIGDITAHMLVTEVPELGLINKKEIAALLGLAPMNRDSGQFKGKRMTGGGRRKVRTRLYMPTLSAIQYNPVIKQFYERLTEKEKSGMTIVVACMRKLIVILNTMIKNDQAWTPYLT